MKKSKTLKKVKLLRGYTEINFLNKDKDGKNMKNSGSKKSFDHKSKESSRSDFKAKQKKRMSLRKELSETKLKVKTDELD